MNPVTTGLPGNGVNVAIIGAGLGGLSCGIHLLLKGFSVKIYEKNSEPGGRASVLEESGFRIDMGPTLVLMPEVLEAIFRAAGRELRDYVRLVPLDPGYRIFFTGGRTFDMTSDPARLLGGIRKFAPVSDETFRRYRKDVRDKFECSRRAFIERNFESFRDMLTPEAAAGLFKIKPFGAAFSHARKFFKNDDLAAAFSCQTLYLGVSPYRAPSLYNLLAYLEFTYGVWYPMGGIGEIPRQLARLFMELGGTLQFNTDVKSVVIENGRATGVLEEDGAVELADVVVSNRDIGSSYRDLVEEKHRPSTTNARIARWRYGQSCALFYFGLKQKVEGLLHHNIFLSADMRKSCGQIFEKGQIPEDPLFYVCVPTKTDARLAPPGKEIVYILAIAPNLKGGPARPRRAGGPVWPRDLAVLRERALARLAREGFEIRPGDIEVERSFTPPDFERRYGSLYGNAFGLGPDFFQSACFRPRTKSPDVRGLYHTGASTHPGTGMPMVLTSGRLVAEQVFKDTGGVRHATALLKESRI